MKPITLGELLTEEQWKEVSEIVDEYTGQPDLVQKLKEYFGNIRPQLESKGVLPEYLAYALPYALEQCAVNIPVPAYN